MGYYLKIDDLLLQIYTNNVLEYVVCVNLYLKSIRKYYQIDTRYSVGIKADHDAGFR